MMSMWTLRSLVVLSALLILEAPRCSKALPKSWMGSRPDEVLPTVPDEEPAPKIDHSAAAAAAQDLVSVSPAINQAFFLPVSKKIRAKKTQISVPKKTEGPF